MPDDGADQGVKRAGGVVGDDDAGIEVAAGQCHRVACAFEQVCGATERQDGLAMAVAIPDASQNAKAGPYESIADGFALVATIAGWHFLLDRAGFHSQSLRKPIDPPPVVRLCHGRPIRRAMRQALITVPELMGKLRGQGFEKRHEVKRARMEGDGQLGVIRVAGASDDPRLEPPV